MKRNFNHYIELFLLRGLAANTKPAHYPLVLWIFRHLVVDEGVPPALFLNCFGWAGVGLSAISFVRSSQKDAATITHALKISKATHPAKPLLLTLHDFRENYILHI